MSERFSDEALEKARDAFNVLFDQQYGELPNVEEVYRAAYAAMRAVLEGHLAPALVAVTARCSSCGAYCDDIQFEYAGAGASDGSRDE